jgi:hypothetical protein
MDSQELLVNVRCKLRHNIGASNSSVQAVINDIFGKSGLKSAENECDFDLQAMELAEKYADKIPRFAAYFSNQCLPNMTTVLTWNFLVQDARV